MGAGNVTEAALPENAVVVTFAGHVIASAGPAGIVVVVVVGGTVVVVVVVVGGGGLGELGDEQAALSIKPARSAVTQARGRGPFFPEKYGDTTNY